MFTGYCAVCLHVKDPHNMLLVFSHDQPGKYWSNGVLMVSVGPFWALMLGKVQSLKCSSGCAQTLNQSLGTDAVGVVLVTTKEEKQIDTKQKPSM